MWPFSASGATSIRTVLSSSGDCLRSIPLLHLTAPGGDGTERAHEARFPYHCTAHVNPLHRQGHRLGQEPGPAPGCTVPPETTGRFPRGRPGRRREGAGAWPSSCPSVHLSSVCLPPSQQCPGWWGPEEALWGGLSSAPQQEEWVIPFNRLEASAPPSGGGGGGRVLDQLGRLARPR